VKAPSQGVRLSLFFLVGIVSVMTRPFAILVTRWNSFAIRTGRYYATILLNSKLVASFVTGEPRSNGGSDAGAAGKAAEVSKRQGWLGRLLRRMLGRHN
jgi:hypothetical protein